LVQQTTTCLFAHLRRTCILETETLQVIYLLRVLKIRRGCSGMEAGES
jgi:hypothetical protein